MIIVKCKKQDCEGHLVGWTNKGQPRVLPNRTHKAEKIEMTEELRQQLIGERCSEPFATFMDVVEEEEPKKPKRRKKQ